MNGISSKNASKLMLLHLLPLTILNPSQSIAFPRPLAFYSRKRQVSNYSSTNCSRTAPTPIVEASVVTRVEAAGSNRVRVGALLMANLSSLTASSASGVQINFFLDEVRSKSGAARVAAWGIKDLYHMTRPKNDCTWRAFVNGVEKAWRASSLLSAA